MRKRFAPTRAIGNPIGRFRLPLASVPRSSVFKPCESAFQRTLTPVYEIASSLIVDEALLLKGERSSSHESMKIVSVGIRAPPEEVSSQNLFLSHCDRALPRPSRI